MQPITRGGMEENLYAAYYSLTDYERECLPTTNYWRARNGLAPIAIPPNNKATKNALKDAPAVEYVELIPPALKEKIMKLLYPPKFSFFKKPVTNIRPNSTLTIKQVAELIKNPQYYGQITHELRNITDKTAAKIYKAAHFDYVTFSGIFKKREEGALIKHSGLLCLDFDRLQYPEQVKQAFSREPFTLLVFTSPTGNGIKWVVQIDLGKADHRAQFKAFSLFTQRKYGLIPDQSGKDIARACFIPHDASAFINPTI